MGIDMKGRWKFENWCRAGSVAFRSKQGACSLHSYPNFYPPFPIRCSKPIPHRVHDPRVVLSIDCIHKFRVRVARSFILRAEMGFSLRRSQRLCKLQLLNASLTPLSHYSCSFLQITSRLVGRIQTSSNTASPDFWIPRFERFLPAGLVVEEYGASWLCRQSVSFDRDTRSASMSLSDYLWARGRDL